MTLIPAIAAAVGCSSDTRARTTSTSPTSPPKSTTTTGDSSDRTAHWHQIRFSYPDTWTLRQFTIPSAPVATGPYLANQALRSPCTGPTDDSCSRLPIATPVSADTVWARWMQIPLPTPVRPSMTAKITVRSRDDAVICPGEDVAGAPLGSFTADWFPSRLINYRLVGCYTSEGADRAVATLRAIAASVVPDAQRGR